MGLVVPRVVDIEAGSTALKRVVGPAPQRLAVSTYMVVLNPPIIMAVLELAPRRAIEGRAHNYDQIICLLHKIIIP